MKVKLHDYLNYLVHITDIDGALPEVIMWNNDAYRKVSKRKYKQASVVTIHDTRGNVPRPDAPTPS